MGGLRDFLDRIFNWSGGSYVGLATLMIFGMALAQFIIGEPVAFLVDGKTVLRVVHKAPDWLVSPVGVYTVILGLFVVAKPINTLVSKVTPAAPAPASAPAERPLEK